MRPFQQRLLPEGTRSIVSALLRSDLVFSTRKKAHSKLLGVIVTLAIISTALNSYSQGPNIVPPTPSAMKMTEFHAQHPNLYTGTARVDVPLHTIDFDGWKLPLSLSYNATGVRTNEEAGEVGLGWSLSATGVVSRTIKGLDDLYQGGGVHNRKGYVYNERSVSSDMGWVPGSGYPDPNSYYAHIHARQPDTQPDIFNYSFFGYSGSFTLSQKIATGNVIKVIKITEDGCVVQFAETGQTFTVITPSGFKGEFTVKEKSSTFSAGTVTPSRMDCCGENLIDPNFYVNDSGSFRTISSWYLSKITSPLGKIITFNYDLNGDGSSPYISNSIAFAEQPGFNPYSPPSDQETCLQTVQEHVYLKEIKIDQEIVLSFQMEDRDDLRKNKLFSPSSVRVLFAASRKLRRFRSITVVGLDPASTLNKSIRFVQTYFNQQYQRLSEDTEDELQFLRSRLDRVIVDDQEYRFFYENGAGGVPNKLTTGIDHFGFYNGQQGKLLPPDPVAGAFPGCELEDTTTVVYYRPHTTRGVDFNYGKAGLLNKVEYPTRGYTTFEYEPHEYLAETTGSFRQQGQIKAGGARVAAIKEFDYSNTSTPAIHKIYRYIQNAEALPAAQISTGKLMTPLYNRYIQLTHPRAADGISIDPEVIDGCMYIYKTFSTIPGNNSAEGKVIGYSRVHEIVKGSIDSYKNTYSFENRANTLTDWHVAVNTPVLNGQVIETRNYNSEGKIVKVSENRDYEHTLEGSIPGIIYERFNDKFLLYAVRHNTKRTFNTPFTVITTVSETPSGIVENANGEITSWGNSLRTEKNVTYNDNFLLKTEQTVNSRNELIKTEYRRPADYTDPSSTLIHMLTPDVNIVEPVIEEITTKNGTVVSAKANLFGLLGDDALPISSYTYNPTLGPFVYSNQASAFPSPYESGIEYFLYDPISKKLLEYKGSDGIVKSFIWGHNATLPVVHGAGITYSKLKEAHDASLGASYETNLRSHAHTAGAMITTYTHIPLIGVSTVTNPAGIKQTFEYDQYGRLKKIIDNEGKTLEQYDYHFRERAPVRILTATGNLNFGTVHPDFFIVQYDGDGLPIPRCTDGLTSRILTLSNTGEDDLTIGFLDMPAGFTSSWSGGTITSGTSVDVVITFEEGTAGAYGGSIIIRNSDPYQGPTSIEVSGVIAARPCGGFTTSINLVDFGSSIEGTARFKDITLFNNSSAPINLTEALIKVPGTTTTHPDFRMNTTLPKCIPANGSITLQLQYAPPVSSVTTANLSFVTDECSTLTNVIELKGERIPLSSRLVVDTNPIAFGSFTEASKTILITLRNQGNIGFTVRGISIANASYAPYFTMTPASTVLDPGESQVVELKFQPTGFVNVDTYITFENDAMDDAATYQLTAKREEVRIISILPSEVNISGHGYTDVMVTNTGNTSLTITGASYADLGSTTYDPTPSDWTVSFTSLPVTLAVGQVASMRIQSILSRPDPQNIRVLYNKLTAYTASDAVEARATIREISLTGANDQMSSFTGPTGTKDIIVKNTGNSTLSITGISSSDSRFKSSATPTTTNPIVLIKDATTTITVTYTPTDFMSQSSSITFTYDGTTSPTASVTVTGKRNELRTISILPAQVNISGHGYTDVMVTNTGNTSLTITGASYADLGSTTYDPTPSDWTASFTSLPVTLAVGQVASMRIQSILSRPDPQNIRVLYNKLTAYTASDVVEAKATIRDISLTGSNDQMSSFTGPTATKDIIVKNTGNSTLSITGISSSNSKFKSSVTPTTTNPIVLIKDATTTITVTYTPTDFMSQSSSITFTYDGTTSPTASLTVTGKRNELRTISILPAQVNISGHGYTDVMVTNTGNTSLTITGASYADLGSSTYDPTPSDWTASFTSTPVTLAVGQVASMRIQSILSRPDPQNIRVLYNKLTAYTASDVVEAKATIRDISLTGSNDQMSSFTGPTATKDIIVKNTGNSTLSITGISSSNSKFKSSVTPTTTNPIVLIKDATTTVTVTYTPTDFTSQSSSITFTYDGTTSPTASLTVTGKRNEVRTISILPAQVNITGHGYTDVMVTNTGNTSLTISGVSYADVGSTTYSSTPSDWTASFTSVPVTLAAGQVASMRIQSILSRPDPQNIRVLYNKLTAYTASDVVEAKATIREISLTGSNDQMSSFTGPTATKDIIVKNTGNSTLSITGISSSDSRFKSSATPTTTNPIVLIKDATTTITVTYTPTDFMSQSSNITFTYDGTSSPTASLTVTGKRTALNEISVSPTSLGIRPMDAEKEILVTNTGNQTVALYIAKDDVAPENTTANFTLTYYNELYQPISNVSGYSLQPGKKVIVRVKYKATGTGALNISTTPSTGLKTVTLSAYTF